MRSDVTTRKTKNSLILQNLSRKNPLIFPRENPLIFSRENGFIFSRETQASKAFQSSRARKPSYYYNFH